MTDKKPFPPARPLDDAELGDIFADAARKPEALPQIAPGGVKGPSDALMQAVLRDALDNQPAPVSRAAKVSGPGLIAVLRGVFGEGRVLGGLLASSVAATSMGLVIGLSVPEVSQGLLGQSAEASIMLDTVSDFSILLDEG